MVQRPCKLIHPKISGEPQEKIQKYLRLSASSILR